MVWFFPSSLDPFISLSYLIALSRITHTMLNKNGEKQTKKRVSRASVVVQWLRIHLPMQGTRVRALVWEDPTCCGATKPTHHNCWACTLGPACHNYWAHVPQLLKPTHLEPVLRNKRSHRNEKPAHRNEEWLPLDATRESPCAATKTQCSQKLINQFFFILIFC